MKQLAISLVICLAVAVWAAGSSDASPKEGSPVCDTTQVTRDVPYLPDPVSDLQRLDVYGFEPAKGCDPAPVVVYVHGGGWRIGDKRSVGAKATYFNELGDVFVSVNYRLSNPPRDPSRPIHPAHAQDVGAAVAWVERNIHAYGGDGDRIALLGHSAGAHLVALVGLDTTFVEQAGGDPSAIRCVLSDDTEAYDVVARAKGSFVGWRLVTNAFGSDEAVWHDASPLAHVDDGTPPPFLVVRRGDAARQAQQTAFVDALGKAGGAVTVLDAPGYTHMQANREIGVPGETVITPTITKFTTRCLGPNPLLFGTLRDV
jgi:acetyl esterase/lipase